MSTSTISVRYVDPFVEIYSGHGYMLTPQEAYDLHQALGALLSQLPQPFEPYPRDENPS